MCEFSLCFSNCRHISTWCYQLCCSLTSFQPNIITWSYRLECLSCIIASMSAWWHEPIIVAISCLFLCVEPFIMPLSSTMIVDGKHGLANSMGSKKNTIPSIGRLPTHWEHFQKPDYLCQTGPHLAWLLHQGFHHFKRFQQKKNPMSWNYHRLLCFTQKPKDTFQHWLPEKIRSKCIRVQVYQ